MNRRSLHLVIIVIILSVLSVSIASAIGEEDATPTPSAPVMATPTSTPEFVPSPVPTQPMAQGILDTTQTGNPQTQPLVDWMMLVYRVIELESVNAPAAARLYGYMGITAYESILFSLPNNVTLAGQISHMPDMPLINLDLEYDRIAVMNTAMATVFSGILPNGRPESMAMISELRDQQQAARLAEVGETVIENSIAYGREVAIELMEWIQGDNYKNTRNVAYNLPVGEGLWELTTEGSSPIEPYWGTIRPLILDYADACAIYPDVPYSTDPTSTFYLQALEVVEVERNLTPWQQETARYWIDTPGDSGAPAGHWWSIATQLVAQLDLSIEDSVNMFAMLGIALDDAFISAWSLKYQFNLLRPVTYIRDNIRRNWTPYVESPPFPEYPSGHSVVSGAAAEVLTRLFGARAFDDQTHVIYGHEPLRRSYTSFWAAADEAAISRLYGGIHYRSAIENGVEQGRCVAETAFRYIRLNPVLQGE